MQRNEISIGGKNYIPAAQAAKLVGYTKDYVGQLARGGKIEAQLIGHSWYISEDSIRRHKLQVHYTLTKEKKPRVSEGTEKRSADGGKGTSVRQTVEPDREEHAVSFRTVEDDQRASKNDTTPHEDEVENETIDRDSETTEEVDRTGAVPIDRSGSVDTAVSEAPEHVGVDEEILERHMRESAALREQGTFVSTPGNRKVFQDELARRALARSSIHYEPGEPIYFEDNGPNIPQTKPKNTYLGNTRYAPEGGEERHVTRLSPPHDIHNLSVAQSRDGTSAAKQGSLRTAKVVNTDGIRSSPQGSVYDTARRPSRSAIARTTTERSSQDGVRGIVPSNRAPVYENEEEQEYPSRIVPILLVVAIVAVLSLIVYFLFFM